MRASIRVRLSACVYLHASVCVRLSVCVCLSLTGLLHVSVCLSASLYLVAFECSSAAGRPRFPLGSVSFADGVRKASTHYEVQSG